jgi:hypothetical protein
MNKSTKKYKKIINQLIKKSFPELKGKIILVSSFNYQIISWGSAFVFSLGFVSWIFVFPKTRGDSKKHLGALFAHELSHINLIVNMNLFEKIVFAFKWWFTKKTKVRFETQADKHTIKKGYAKCLFDRVKNTEKKRSKEELKKRSARGYLSSKQIKKYAKKIGKW